MSDTTKILILVGSVIIVCVLCAVGFKMTNEGKSAVNASTNNFNNMTSQYQDIDKAIYDGATVQGSEVVSLIKKTINSEEYVSVLVNTKAGAKTYYNYRFKEDTATLVTTDGVKDIKDNKGEEQYINPSAQFSGQVYKDANNIIICIEFTQI